MYPGEERGDLERVLSGWYVRRSCLLHACGHMRIICHAWACIFPLPFCHLHLFPSWGMLPVAHCAQSLSCARSGAPDVRARAAAQGPALHLVLAQLGCGIPYLSPLRSEHRNMGDGLVSGMWEPLSARVGCSSEVDHQAMPERHVKSMPLLVLTTDPSGPLSSASHCPPGDCGGVYRNM